MWTKEARKINRKVTHVGNIIKYAHQNYYNVYSTRYVDISDIIQEEFIKFFLFYFLLKNQLIVLIIIIYMCIYKF